MTARPHDPEELAARFDPAGKLESNLEGCGDFGIRIGRDGTWYYWNSPIGRLPLVKLFASVLRREAGDYWLVTPVERGRIEVEDAPFVAVGLEREGTGTAQILTFRTNLDETVAAGPAHPIRVVLEGDKQEPRPYIHVRGDLGGDLDGGLEALIARMVFYDMVELAEPQTVDGVTRYGVWSQGQFFPLD